MAAKRRGRALDGVLLLDKPSGLSSFKAVDRARRALDAAKAGHTGTLDPLATGLMQICFGRATRLVQFLTGLDKRYRASIALGVSTTTYDAEGDIVERAPPAAIAAITRAQVEQALARQIGTIGQRPPAFSAIKVDGERLYAKARRGEAVVVPIREVCIHSLTLLSFTPTELVVDVHCGKGTYVRSIAADLGAELGVGGHLSALRRTAIGLDRVEDAIPLADLEAEPGAARLASLADATAHLPTLALDAAALGAVRNGVAVTAPDDPPARARVLDERGDLVAILEPEGGRLRVARGFQS